MEIQKINTQTKLHLTNKSNKALQSLTSNSTVAATTIASVDLSAPILNERLMVECMCARSECFFFGHGLFNVAKMVARNSQNTFLVPIKF